MFSPDEDDQNSHHQEEQEITQSVEIPKTSPTPIRKRSPKSSITAEDLVHLPLEDVFQDDVTEDMPDPKKMMGTKPPGPGELLDLRNATTTLLFSLFLRNTMFINMMSYQYRQTYQK